ncbi:hypothetical protein LCGC14_1050900, partial [marine sediment metagenome]
MKIIRKAAVAGTFYPRYKPDLLNTLEESFTNKEFGPGEAPKSLNQEQRTIIGGVSPHAGYIYSGCCAAFTYLNLFKERIPDTVIILGTDHIGYGKVALMKDGEWETPLGNLFIDDNLSNKILENSNTIIEDESAFIGFPYGREHNIEVQLPFIKSCAQDKDVKILPIKVAVKEFNLLDKISTDIASIINSYSKDVVIIASSDMTHKEISNVEGLNKFKERDQKVIDSFIEFNPEKTLKTASSTT